MEQNKKERRWLRVASALFFALILLAMLLPSTTAFFGPVGLVMASTACILFGIVRRNVCEPIGWCMYGIILLWMLFGG
jgi:hypothetical protein